MFNFYLFNKEKRIVISDYPSDKVKGKFGFQYEILNSVKEKSALPFISERIKKQYPLYSIVEFFTRPRKPHTEETKRKMALAKIGKPRDEATKQKISIARKGKSNFEGKKHNEETKKIMAEKKLGNQHVKDLRWVHDPRGTEEKRVKDRTKVPVGFSLGRDYYSTEPGLYYFKKK